MNASKTQLVAKITIYQNKQESNKIGRKQDDFITIVPWPLLYIASLITITAIHKYAFETPFSSLEDILNRPILENTNYIVLPFARVLEFDAHERLYGLLENASFRRDEDYGPSIIASPGAFIEMGLAYLENLPDMVKTVAAKHAPTMQTPSGTPLIKPDAEAVDDPDDLDDPDVRPRRRNFDRPFNCPECTQYSL
ncbi:hypothetical protein CMUS01_03678 [Colletotrichum musicola]|uniref:Uncharacterized protein n=1 Tax=Colletotrichum musicola TaxID=2175873 RepID=A0A8H6NRA9_9PEZI|nr:hypothetical protein CMUS01_03678 [Colletotrichum musicola]